MKGARGRYRFIILIIAAIFLVVGNVSLASAGSAVTLTDQEKAFIREHPVIKLGVDPEFLPYEFIDTDGNYKGIAADYIQLICERTGLNMEVEYGLTWQEAYNKAVNRELDVLPCVSKTVERQKYFIYSNAYYTFKRVIFIREDEKNINRFTDLMYRKVAVQDNSSHSGFLKTYQSIELSLYDDVGKALLAVSEGKESAFVGNLATSSYLIKKMGITNLRYIEVEPIQNESLYFAVRNDWPELTDIINKGIKSITQEERIQISNKWLGVEQRIDYARVMQIAVIFLVVVAIVIAVSAFWIVRLKREVKARKKIEEELRIAKEEAEAANNIKSTFLARMSHEIRTPLNAITGMVYLIEKTDVTITQKLYLNKITQASMNMLGIINDILDFSKIEAGKVQLERISFNMDKVIQQVVNIISYRIDENSIEFITEKDTDLPVHYFGDPTRLEQILLNLLNNALKFTKKGSVSLILRLISKKDEIYRVQFIVKDTGIGMSDEQQRQLFEPFNQADSSISRQYGGTGLGLSIVKNLIAMMDGEIEVESELEKGSTFMITIPLEADLSKEDLQEKKSVAELFSKLHLLVVDKNIKALNQLMSYLESFNIRAEHAVTEEIAMELLDYELKKGSPYDLIVIDYDTPKSGGLEFFREVKDRFKEYQSLKSILMIPLMKEELFEKIAAAGIDLGLSKPIMPSMLYNGIVEIYKSKVLKTHEKTDSSELVIDDPENYSILVVEDNSTNQMIAQNILEQEGYKVILADNGQEGCRSIQEKNGEIGLVLMDLHMPIMNGYDAAAAIRQFDPEVPILAMTADAITGVEEKCRNAGMTGYISKPFDPKDFLKKVGLALAAKKYGIHQSEVSEGNSFEPESMEDLVILDKEEGIGRIGGDEALYNMILSEFYKENKDTGKLLESAIQNKDYIGAKHIVHKIKGSSGNIGARAMFEVSAELQSWLEQENEEKIRIYQKRFLKIWKLLMDEIKVMLWY